jgi:PAS domain S-box-containing protein
MTEHNNSEHVGGQPGAQYRFDLADDSVMTRTLEGKIEFWNRRAEELYGWRQEEAVGKVSHDLLQTQFPKPLEEIDSELVRAGRWQGKLVHTTRDGQRVVVDSRWTFEASSQPGAVVEINTPTTNNSRNDQGVLTTFANLVLIAGGSLALLILFYFLYHYGWAQTKHFTSTTGILLYCVFPAVLATLLFAFLRRRPEVRISAIVFCLSSAFALYLGEVVLTVANSGVSPPLAMWGNQIRSPRQKDHLQKIATEFGVTFDTRSKVEVINDLRNRGIDAVPAITPIRFLNERRDGTAKSSITVDGLELLPLAGVSDSVTVFCNEIGEYAIYESDEHGFNNPKGLWQSDRLQIAAVGDSLTQGACVPPEKNFVSLIRGRHHATLNLGIASHGPLLMLATLKEYLPELKPPIVLWFYFEGNDPSDIRLEKKSPLLMRYMEQSFRQGLRTRQPDVDQALKLYIQAEMAKEVARLKTEQAKQNGQRINTDTIANVLKLSRLRQALIEGNTAKNPWARFERSDVFLFREILQAAQTSVHAWGGRLYFIYLPAWERYAQSGFPDREPVLRAVESLGIPIVDIHPVFEAHGDALSFFPFRRFGHYNEQGNRVVAEAVLKSPELK